MKLMSLTIRGFRCFNADGQTVRLGAVNCLVGPNASGKTAMMMALVRLFGEHPAQRQLTTDDFHIPAGEQLKDTSERWLSIECRIDFPELAAAGTAVGDAVPESFNQMIVDAPGKPPYCRLRLEGTWTDNGTPLGDVEQSLFWILTESDDPSVIDDGNRRKVRPGERRRIRVIYVPAARDPERQIAITTSTAYGRLMSGLSLNGAEEQLLQGLQHIQSQVGALKGVETLNSNVQELWTALYSGNVAKRVAFRALEGEPAELLSLLTAHFAPGEDGRMMLSRDLSDGMRSLFSLCLSLGLFQVEQALITAPVTSGFKEDLAHDMPYLTVFAVEEPENHLSPHYLGRVVTELTRVAANAHAQVLLSSHCPAILKRVRPDDVRYFLGNEQVAYTRIKSLSLPEDGSDEAFKYVREAVRGYPELYFSRLAIFGEGPSEEIILKRVFEASGVPLDASFISVVPLGGRHINHFWRLVHSLEIPHITLLDLDREKEGAGWARLEYVRNELIKQLGATNPRFRYKDDRGRDCNMAADTFVPLSSNDGKDVEGMAAWINLFQRQFDIYFSAPLDIDFAMLEAFPAEYRSLADRGPRLPDPGSPDYKTAIIERTKQVLAANPKTAPDTIGETYSDAQQELFPWYKYLFIDGSKPVTHMRAMIALQDDDLMRCLPVFLGELTERAQSLVDPTELE